VVLRVRFLGDKADVKIKRNLARNKDEVAVASRQALVEARRRILEAGRADIKKGGNFGLRWTNSLQGEITPREGKIINMILTIFHIIPYARIFEYGGVIKGKPLLWIPLPWSRFKGRARDFPGRLFRVDREGKNPLLMQNKGGVAEAKYVGVKQVRQKRRFHLRPIIRRVAKQIPFLYRRAARLARRR
jgi:hypothetical protein